MQRGEVLGGAKQEHKKPACRSRSHRWMRGMLAGNGYKAISARPDSDPVLHRTCAFSASAAALATAASSAAWASASSSAACV